jgi:hypothetical protein
LHLHSWLPAAQWLAAKPAHLHQKECWCTPCCLPSPPSQVVPELSGDQEIEWLQGKLTEMQGKVQGLLRFGARLSCFNALLFAAVAARMPAHRRSVASAMAMVMGFVAYVLVTKAVKCYCLAGNLWFVLRRREAR